SRMGEMGSMSMGGQDEIAEMFDRIAMSTPEQAAKAILGGVQKNQRRVLIGADAVSDGHHPAADAHRVSACS
ncbi:hypothetical protein RZS08_41130, partial [Arthrospira platensis SPKY1]|nr:hypothetical protein [Arthrospira platensis SPKY1]